MRIACQIVAVTPDDLMPPDLPALLADSLRRDLAAFVDAVDATGRAALESDSALRRAFAQVAATSRFVLETLTQEPALLGEMYRSGALSGAAAAVAAEQRFARLDEVVGEQAFMDALRRLRRHEWLRIAWRDLAGLADIDEVLRDQSTVAEGCIVAALERSRRLLAPRFGSAVDRHGASVDLLVLGMGKLGGWELNFSSDIDLVFLYSSAGETNGRSCVANETYFVRLGQKLIRLLDEATPEGFVFRVDMRLRPFGDSGPLALSYAAFEAYLQQHGRDWERYAYIKARPLSAHDRGEELRDQVLRPFVYRRYLDFGVFAALREMKALIDRDVARRDLRDNIKLGPGGIREIEFVAQLFQLVRGGSIPQLRTTELRRALTCLAAKRLLAPEVVDHLRAAYRFLRRVENRLQAHAQKQTHDLPPEDTARARLAYAMGYSQWSEFATELAAHRERVSSIFEEVVIGPERPGAPGLRGVWDEDLDVTEIKSILARSGVEDGAAIARIIADLRTSGLYRRLDETGRRRLDALMPKLVARLVNLSEPRQVMRRLTRILSAVGRRSAYFALLSENPLALARLVELCGETDFLAGRIAEHPLLLDELLDPRIFSAPPERAELESTLNERLEYVDGADVETQMEVLREFQRAASFRVAVSDLSGQLPVMKVSDRLTDIAELILERTLAMAQTQLVERHGWPVCVEEGERRRAGFAVVAYGKLGGIELGYGSDLDLVFLHDSCGEEQYTDGDKTLDNARFFARLGQRIINLLSTQTRSGVLYEVDMRLRPSGNSGPMVAALRAFEKYQREDAWTWEHQALLRARSVAGAATVRQQFERLRCDVLREAVRRDTLQHDVATMRARMRRELSRAEPGGFDLKQDRGGVADLEFIVQYLVLRHAADTPQLLTYSDNVRQLEALSSEGVVEQNQAQQLTTIYLAFRQRLHRLALIGAEGIIDAGELSEEREYVAACWDSVFATGGAAG